MASTSEDRIRLLDIADSVREIQSYIGGGSFKDYSTDEHSREAVTQHLLQIGGAAAMLSDEFKETYGEIDWDLLTGLQYANFDEKLELDLHPIWHIVSDDLPEIMNQVLDLAAVLEADEDLESVTLNEEDLQDVKDLHFKKELDVNPQNQDIDTEDEAEDSNIEDDMTVIYPGNRSEKR
ncbi:MAG: DUF86 domain-containing protein [Cytophagaceae bacterium]